MRTTIDIPDNILIEAKKQASDRHSTLAKVVSDALRAAFLAATEANSEPVGALPTFKGNGPRPGVRLDSHADLLDLMEPRP